MKDQIRDLFKEFDKQWNTLAYSTGEEKFELLKLQSIVFSIFYLIGNRNIFDFVQTHEEKAIADRILKVRMGMPK